MLLSTDLLFFLVLIVSLLNLVFFVGGLELHMMLRYHPPPISVKSVLHSLLKSSRVGVCFSVFFLSSLNCIGKHNNSRQIHIQRFLTKCL